MFENLKSSAKELKNVQNMVICAMLMAISMAIHTYSIDINENVRIGFSFVANNLAYMLFGPITGAIFGGVKDILNYIIKPVGPFFPPITIVEMLTGFIYGLILYKKPHSFLRILVAHAVVAVVINITLRTGCLYLLNGKSAIAAMPLRITKNLIMFPINACIFYSVTLVLKQAKLIPAPTRKIIK